MSKTIDGTEDFAIPFKEYTASDNAKVRDQIITDFMRRFVLHTHSGSDSKRAALPTRLSKNFDKADITFTLQASGLYKVPLSLIVGSATINPQVDNLNFYLQSGSGALDDTAWQKFYPTFDVDSNEQVSVYVIGNDLHLKVSA